MKTATDAIYYVPCLVAFRASFEKATFPIKASWINWRIDRAEVGSTLVCEARIYAGSVTADLTDLVIEARAIFGLAHSVELKIGQDLSVNDRAGGVQHRCPHLSGLLGLRLKKWGCVWNHLKYTFYYWKAENKTILRKSGDNVCTPCAFVLKKTFISRKNQQ